MEDNGLWLVTTIVELAEMLDERQSEAGYGSALAARLTERIAPAEICLMVAGNAGDLAVTGASSGMVDELAALQVRLKEGPCIDCHQSGQAVTNNDISTADKRWPRFAPAAAAADFGIVSALPMRRRQQAIGVLFAAAAGTHPLTDGEIHDLSVVARTTAIAIAQQRDLRRSVLAAEQLQRALDSRVLIEQAKGAVAARLGISPDGAFELLRRYARRQNLTLVEVSGQAIRNSLSPHDLMADAHRPRASHERASQLPHS